MKWTIVCIVLQVISIECNVTISNVTAITNATNQNASSVMDARRQDYRLPFGATYPYGYTPLDRTTTVDRNRVFNPRYGVPDKLHLDHVKIKHRSVMKTPPTNFFPKGSSTVTATMKLLQFAFKNKYVTGNPYPMCALFTYSCLKAYDTGYICARAQYDTYYTFNNYCALEYTNCVSKATVWTFAYMGDCYIFRNTDAREEFHIEGDNFLEAALINEPPFNPMEGQNS